MPFCASTDALHRCRWPTVGLAALAILLALSGTEAIAQTQTQSKTQDQAEEEDLTAGLASLESHLKQGKALFADLKFPEAIAELDQVVAVYEAGKLQEGGESAIRSVAEALDLRARAHFNQGDQERARDDFALLLKVKIDYQIDRKLVSPKVIELYEQVKKENVGTLSVTTDPPGAEVYLNDELISRTPITGRAIIQGTYRLKLVLKGFQDQQEDLILNPRSELKRDIKLTPNLRTLQFITEPTGVNVIIDGVLAGTTFGSLPLDSQTTAKEAGLDPAKASAPLLVQYVTKGQHQVRFEKECYEAQLRSIEVSLDVEKNAPQVFQPVVLKQQIGQIRVTSHPSGAEVFVDGISQGATPLQQAAVCAGERDIRLVKKGEGLWFDRVRIKPDVTNLLDATLRPTLLYLGTFRLDEWDRLNWSDEDKLLLEGMKFLKSVNQVRPDDTLKSYRSLLESELQQPAQADKLHKGASLPPARVLDALSKFQADLLLVGISVSEQGGKGSQSLFLFSSEQPEPDVVSLDLSKDAEVKEFLARLDRPADLTRPWMGVAFTDTLLGDGPVVVRVVKGGPAAKAGLLAGDQVLSVNGRRVAEAKALSVGGAGWKVNDRLSFTVRRETSTQNITLTVEETPLLIPLSAPDRLYNKALCDYRQLARGADDPLDRVLAQVNLGLTFMHFRAYDKALSESLSVVSLPPGGGISRGTVRYYQGLCYLRKDLVPEARTAFQEAAASVDATLESNDGPPVSPRAKNLLQ